MRCELLQGGEERLAGIHYEYDASSKPLGEGAMGRVFKGYRVVEATGQRTPVAVKCIFEGIPERLIERAIREASVRIDHKNLLRMYSFIEMVQTSTINGITTSYKRYFVVMELLEGVTLHDFLQGHLTDQEGNIFPSIEALHLRFQKDKLVVVKDIVMGILDGLQALHDFGVLHRDLDPSNIMMTADGGLKIIDFGICKQQNTLNTQDKGLTVSGIFMGKPYYASPELAIGDVVHQNQTTDIYAVGVILFQLCTGHVPFSGPNNEVLASHMRKPLPVKEIDIKPLQRIVSKATEKVQGNRYQSAMEFKADMMKFGIPNRNKHMKDNKLIVGISVLLIAAVALGILWALAGRNTDQTATAKTETTKTEQVKIADDYNSLSINTEQELIFEDSIPTDSIAEPEQTNVEKKVLKKRVKVEKKEVEEQVVEVKAEEEAQPVQEVEVINVYYIIGTKDELQEKGLLTKGNLFKKKKVNLSNIDNSMFVKCDMNKLYRINIPAPAKKVKILTGNRENAYSIEKVDDNNSVLTIRRPKTFWFDSKYLIIRILE